MTGVMWSCYFVCVMSRAALCNAEAVVDGELTLTRLITTGTIFNKYVIIQKT